MSRIPHLSSWQRKRLKDALRGVARFSATVIASAVLAAWLLDSGAAWRRWVNHGLQHGASVWRKSSTVRPGTVSAGLASAPPVVSRAPGAVMNARSFGERYVRYYEEAMPLLRADSKVRLVSIDVPASVLNYQQNAAANVAGFRLATTNSRIPVIAVSRNAREFLATMRITFIDPKALPEDFHHRTALPMSWDTLEDGFVLVPDLSPGHANQFLFTHR